MFLKFKILGLGFTNSVYQRIDGANVIHAFSSIKYVFSINIVPVCSWLWLFHVTPCLIVIKTRHTTNKSLNCRSIWTTNNK